MLLQLLHTADHRLLQQQQQGGAGSDDDEGGGGELGRRVQRGSLEGHQGVGALEDLQGV